MAPAGVRPIHARLPGTPGHRRLGVARSALRPDDIVMRNRLPLLAVFAVLCVQAGPSTLAAQTFDVLIRDARVVDGSGNPWFRADVGIDGDRIAAVGDLSGAGAAMIVEADGMYLAPGFIDTHSHASGGLATADRSSARPQLAQGVTTVFVNPDGGGRVDLLAQQDSLLKDGLGVNVAQFVPHGSVRGAVIGSEDRLATPAELDRMRALVRAGMEAGGWGLSSGPFYAPGSYSDTHELVELAKVVAHL